MSLSAELDRCARTNAIKKLYITPNDPKIVELKDEILNNKPFWRSNWQAFCDWINSEITYEPDSGEYWKLPRETLEQKTGDCEDQAILLCSLLRAVGYDRDSAFVILGRCDDVGHAWVRIFAEILGIGIWMDIEATNGGLTIFQELLGLVDYDDAYQFNDIRFEKLK